MTEAELENVHSVLPFKMTVRAELRTSESEAGNLHLKNDSNNVYKYSLGTR